MWKIVAVFLLLLVLVAVSAINREGFTWMLTLFFAFLGVGIFIYALSTVRSEKKVTGELKNIRSTMGVPSFNKAMEEIKSSEQAAENRSPASPAAPIELPKLSVPEHPAEPVEHNEIHVPSLEAPKLVVFDSSQVKDVPETGPTVTRPVKLQLKIKPGSDDPIVQ